MFNSISIYSKQPGVSGGHAATLGSSLCAVASACMYVFWEPSPFLLCRQHRARSTREAGVRRRATIASDAGTGAKPGPCVFGDAVA